jgi:hypothetical protein
MGAGASDAGHAFDGTNAFSLFGGFHGGAFSAWSGADDDDIKFFVCRVLHGKS